MIRHLFLFALLLLVALPTYAQRRTSQQLSASSQAFAQQAQTLRELEMTVQRLSARFDAIEQQQLALATRVGKLERGEGVASTADVAALRADLNAIRSKQEAMRGEIVEDLSTRITKIAKQQQQARAAEKATQKSGYSHVVEAGQTISAIAEAYKVTASSIIKANKISDPTKIRVGQKLFIPDP